MTKPSTFLIKLCPSRRSPRRSRPPSAAATPMRQGRKSVREQPRQSRRISIGPVRSVIECAECHLAMLHDVPACRRHSLKNACVVVMYARPSADVPQPGTFENAPG
jgi:hypothetical protein